MTLGFKFGKFKFSDSFASFSVSAGTVTMPGSRAATRASKQRSRDYPIDELILKKLSIMEMPGLTGKKDEDAASFLGPHSFYRAGMAAQRWVGKSRRWNLEPARAGWEPALSVRRPKEAEGAAGPSQKHGDSLLDGDGFLSGKKTQRFPNK